MYVPSTINLFRVSWRYTKCNEYATKGKSARHQKHNQSTKRSLIHKPIPCYLSLSITMNFDGESIMFDDLGAATPLLPMCVRKKSACYTFAELQDMSSLHLWQIIVKQYC